MTQAEALIAILSQPTPKGLERIGYRYTQPRSQLVSPDLLKRELAIAYIEWRRQQHADQSEIVSLRRHRGRASVIERWRKLA